MRVLVLLPLFLSLASALYLPLPQEQQVQQDLIGDASSEQNLSLNREVREAAREGNALQWGNEEHSKKRPNERKTAGKKNQKKKESKQSKRGQKDLKKAQAY